MALMMDMMHGTTPLSLVGELRLGLGLVYNSLLIFVLDIGASVVAAGIFARVIDAADADPRSRLVVEAQDVAA
jgi:hypothetical protein